LVVLGLFHEIWCFIYGVGGVGYPGSSIASFCASLSGLFGALGFSVVEGISSINKNEAVGREV
jgi:hypothetical protein